MNKKELKMSEDIRNLSDDEKLVYSFIFINEKYKTPLDLDCFIASLIYKKEPFLFPFHNVIQALYKDIKERHQTRDEYIREHIDLYVSFFYIYEDNYSKDRWQETLKKFRKSSEFQEYQKLYKKMRFNYRDGVRVDPSEPTEKVKAPRVDKKPLKTHSQHKKLEKIAKDKMKIRILKTYQKDKSEGFKLLYLIYEYYNKMENKSFELKKTLDNKFLNSSFEFLQDYERYEKLAQKYANKHIIIVDTLLDIYPFNEVNSAKELWKKVQEDNISDSKELVKAKERCDALHSKAEKDYVRSTGGFDPSGDYEANIIKNRIFNDANSAKKEVRSIQKRIDDKNNNIVKNIQKLEKLLRGE